ncbi:MAG: response regulator transcription factor [Gammaproteobacteria bacterium]
MARILLIEDEAGLVLTLSDRLASEGYEVISEMDGISGLERAGRETFDLILLDIMLPGKNGFDVCRELRDKKVEVPILMLTAKGMVADKVAGLKLGADDYLTKPFEMIELLARVEALLRRASSGRDLRRGGVVQIGDVEVHLDEARVEKNGSPVQMSARMFKLLRFFIEYPDVVVSRDEILNQVWGYDATPSSRTVDVHVAWLRQRIENDPHNPEHIVTVHGLGYKFLM